MTKKILAVGLELASDDVVHEEFISKVSLLDWDIVLFKPIIDEFITHNDHYKGKPSLSDSYSFKLKESCEHWRREIKQAVESGKTVIAFLPAVQEVYIDTGDRQYSGTGRNRATTRIVAPYSNYCSLPIELSPTNTCGTVVRLASKGAEVLAPYWSEFSSYSEYNVLLTNADLPACLVTKNGEKPVGVLFRSKISSGTLTCLPNVDFYRKEFLDKKEEMWTNEGHQFSARFINAIISLDVALHNAGEITPEPIWVSNQKYSLAVECSLRVDLLDAESKLEAAQRNKENILAKLQSSCLLRGLLYEKGKPLENAIIDALRLFGFSAKSYKEGNSEFDVVFESEDGRLIGEAEGKDGKAINVDKLHQLAMNINEDLQRGEVVKPAKGVLFGNGYRLAPPEKRAIAFTEKCITAAQSLSTALVETQHLFRAARYLSDREDASYAMECRKAIFNSSGLVVFPETPSAEGKMISESELKDMNKN
jgi:hypothetical protein